ncbi:MAG: DUF5330 domain-containing protein [Pseudolabrys sp.]|nr:DUF5330 domain-containing protein [Pseudolabrys sp.]MBV9955017.1 DUF5330 domain-containing protein [Pseudolabrys sp.]
MFFMLRMAFWLGIVCVLLPVGNGASSGAQVDPASAVSAASATISDMSNFCGRQPEACEVGGKVAVAIGHKAEAGARTLYDIISAKLNEKGEKQAAEPRKSAASTQGTLTATDLAAAWQAPVPLPPRREAKVGRPAA